jgi:hypothetical protein
MAMNIMDRLNRSHGVQAGVVKSIGDGYDLFVYKLSSLDRDWRTHHYGITLTKDGQELERRVYRSDEFRQGLTHAIRNRKLGGVEYLGRAVNPYPGSGCPHTHFTELSRDLGAPLAAWIERRKHGAGWPRQCEENLLDFHGPAYAEAKEREARAMERRGNPESSAAALYETFHGAPSTETLELTQDIHYHSHLTVLGDLVELKVNTFTGKQATISFSADDPEGSTKLCSNEAGTQLYIEGGDQSLDLPGLGFNKAQSNRDHVAIGVIYELTYRAKKQFHKFKLTDYYHGLGEESGYEPILNFDTMNQSMTVSGGEYQVKAEGIVN